MHNEFFFVTGVNNYAITVFFPDEVAIAKKEAIYDNFYFHNKFKTNEYKNYPKILIKSMHKFETLPK